MTQGTYREGDDATGDEGMEEHAVPITGFLIVMKPNGSTDVVLDLPGFECSRKATMSDVRDMANSVSSDAQIHLNANAAAGEFSRAMSKATAQMRPNPTSLENSFREGLSPKGGKG